MTAKFLSECLGVVLGDGSHACFWNDLKVNGISLAVSFPRIHALAIKKSGKVGSLASGLILDGNGGLRPGDLFLAGKKRFGVGFYLRSISLD